MEEDDRVQARVITKDMTEFYSNTVTIQNSPPQIVSAVFSPEKPQKGDTISINIESSDPDSDNVDYSYKWYVNGKHISSDETLEGDFKRDDKVTVFITASDGEDQSNLTYKFENTIYNSSPIISEKLENESFENGIYKVTVRAHDPDGDTLNYSIKEKIENLTISQNGEVNWKAGFENPGEHVFTVLINDGHGSEIGLPVTVNITTKTISPE